MNEKKKSLFKKIQALLSKTVANGCSEDEAMSALDKAKALMDEHDFSDTELEFTEPVEVNTKPQDDNDEIRARLCIAVGAFCGCMSYKSGFERIAYAGLYSETVFAHWLLDTLEEFVKRECRNWLERNPSRYRVRRTESRGFIYGCSLRISERLHELAKQRHKPGSELVVKKNALVQVALKNAGIILRPQWTIKTINITAEVDGQKVGDQATFDKPLTGDTIKPLAIR